MADLLVKPGEISPLDKLYATVVNGYAKLRTSTGFDEAERRRAAFGQEDDDSLSSTDRAAIGKNGAVAQLGQRIAKWGKQYKDWDGTTPFPSTRWAEVGKIIGDEMTALDDTVLDSSLLMTVVKTIKQTFKDFKEPSEAIRRNLKYMQGQGYLPTKESVPWGWILGGLAVLGVGWFAINHKQ